MDKKVLQTESASERKRILQDTCVRAEEFTYSKQFTPEELTHKKDELAQQDIKLERLEVEKKEVTTDYNTRIKVLKEDRSKTLNGVRTGVEEVTEQVYLLDDQESKKMGYYNSKGELVYERPMMPEERQLRIVDKEKLTGTNN
jgi:hypothetical protein